MTDRIEALGVAFDVTATVRSAPECVTITAVDVRLGGQAVGCVICEDAQGDIDAAITESVRREYGRRVVLAAGVDGGGFE